MQNVKLENPKQWPTWKIKIQTQK